MDLEERTLLLCPPTFSSNPDLMASLAATYPRATTDIQMLDRLASQALVSLPSEHYSRAVILTDPSVMVSLEIPPIILEKVFRALRKGGRLENVDPNWGKGGKYERVDALLNGFLVEENERQGTRLFVKPMEEKKMVAIPLRRKKADVEVKNGLSATTTVPTPTLGSTVNGSITTTTSPPPPESIPNGVGFSDDAGEEDLIDEDALLDDIDNLSIPIQQRKQILSSSHLTNSTNL